MKCLLNGLQKTNCISQFQVKSINKVSCQMCLEFIKFLIFNIFSRGLCASLDQMPIVKLQMEINSLWRRKNKPFVPQQNACFDGLCLNWKANVSIASAVRRHMPRKCKVTNTAWRYWRTSLFANEMDNLPTPLTPLTLYSLPEEIKNSGMLAFSRFGRLPKGWLIRCEK